MSGHSKWATIKRKKASLDAKKGKHFTKVSKEIIVAAKQGGGDPAANARLRTLIDKARALNMPADNISRAIKKGTGELPGAHYEEHTYEGYGPHGIAVIVQTLTDNKNRTVAELRKLFSDHQGRLAEHGSVQWMFKQCAVVRATGIISEDKLLESLLDYDIKDVVVDEENFSIIVQDSTHLQEVKHVLETCALNVESAQVEMLAQTKHTLPEQDCDIAYEFLSLLDEYDDVQNVYTNLV